MAAIHSAPALQLTCINFYCAHTVPHFAAYHLEGGDRMYACSACNTTQRVSSHVWQEFERTGTQPATVQPVEAGPVPTRSMPIPWTTAYHYALKYGAPSLARCIASKRHHNARTAGNVIEAAKWMERFSAACDTRRDANRTLGYVR